MRKQLRRTVVAVVILLLLMVCALVGRSLWQQRRADIVQKGLEFLPGVSQHIQDFHRVKLLDGRKVWEVSARDAQYFEEDKTVVVQDAMMELYLEDGRNVGLKGEQGRILLDGRDVTTVALNGDIEVSLADYLVRTAQATYDHGRNQISAPGPVEIIGRALHLRGDSMEVDVGAQRVRLEHHITMRIEPALLKKGEADAPL
jgi:LPS export ABC transporter protein LptC